MNDSTKKKKRNNFACIRCRKRHMKCPGGNPCEKCKSTNQTCEYSEINKKIMISINYLEKLHEEIATLKKQNGILRSKEASINNSSKFNPISLENNENNNTNKFQNEIVPPFIDRQRRLVSSKTGEKFYVGSSSMTLFGLEVESMIPNNILNNKILTNNGELNPDKKLNTILENEGNAYKIILGKTDTKPGISVKFILPSYSYALLLIDTFITYNDGCFYFFNEGLVKENLKKTYNNNLNTDKKETLSNKDSIIETINFCKFLLIFAIGEMYLGTVNNDKKSDSNLPGSGFFQQANELFTGLFASGAIDNVAREGGVEVMLLYAFYLQVADCTVASYFYFGIALRASLILGLHVDVEKNVINRFELEHRRRLWWTVYMFERMLSSKAGLPLSLSDESISTDLPQDFDMTIKNEETKNYIFPEAEYIRNCVKIVQINSLILSSLYQKEPKTNILPIIAELIKKLFHWKENLPDFLKPNFSINNFKISRLVTNIMTEYFQGVNLAVRPLLFYLTTKQIKSNKNFDKYIDLTSYSESILTLLNASFQGSINTIRSLWSLMSENMVALFGYMDREYLFTSAATLILFNVAFGVFEVTNESLQNALLIFTKMKNLGNNPAELRLEQLIKLMETLNFNNKMNNLIEKFTKSDNNDIKTDNPKRNSKIINKKLINKEKRIKVNNNRFIYQKNIINNPETNNEVNLPKFDNNNINNIDDFINYPISHIRNNDNFEFVQNENLNVNNINKFENLINSDLIFNEINFNDFDSQLWDEITNQPIWLSDVGEEFQNLMNNMK